MLKTFKNTEDGILVRLLKWIALRILPTSVCNWLGVLLYGSEYRLSLGSVHLGNLRRVTPISRVFGCDRGQPIDRYYIENFLANCSSDIHIHVPEVRDSRYTCSYGGNRVTKSDVIHVDLRQPLWLIFLQLTRFLLNLRLHNPGANAPLYLRCPAGYPDAIPLL